MKAYLKGDIGLSKVAADLIERECVASIPLSEHSPFDITATNLKTCETKQFKLSIEQKKKGVIFCDLTSS